MRALLDTNVIISYLLTPHRESAPRIVLEAALDGVFTLLVADAILAELARRASTKPYLAQRITPDDLDRLIRALGTVAIRIPAITDAIPAVGRDPKDDYLLAYAVVGRADYLVTGDQDLLSLEGIGDHANRVSACVRRARAGTRRDGGRRLIEPRCQ